METIGAGGFAVTYRGIRQDTGEVVAIKEYFPPSLAVRTKQEGFYVLHPFPEKNTGLFQKGLRRFVNEAGILKSFQNLESIVPVYDLFEENGTAYLVMEYINGLTLGQYVTENGTFTFPEISALIAPVIRSLTDIHARGLIHRDVSPDNLILGTDNRLHLIDFGAASRESAGDTKNTVIIKAGYAPPEQYLPSGKTGAWIDVYAVCATIYFCVTGHAPAEAMRRLDAGSRQPLPHLGHLLSWQYAILEKGLQLRPADRFQSAGELYAALTGTEEQVGEATVLRTEPAEAASPRRRRFPVSAGKGRRFSSAKAASARRARKKILPPGDGQTFGMSTVLVRRVLAAVIGIAVLGGGGVFLFRMFGGGEPGRQQSPEISGSGGSAIEQGVSVGMESQRPRQTDNDSETQRPRTDEVSEMQPPRQSDNASRTQPPRHTDNDSQADTLVMPDVTGKILEKAKKKIHALDPSIQINVSYAYDKNVGKGKVVGQSIAKGVYFTKKQIPSISLTVSKGKKPSATVRPKPDGQEAAPPDYKVNGDDDLVTIPLE